MIYSRFYVTVSLIDYVQPVWKTLAYAVHILMFEVSVSWREALKRQELKLLVQTEAELRGQHRINKTFFFKTVNHAKQL